MWPFQKKKQREEPPRWREALADLQERVSILDKEVRDIRLDWNTTYDKFHALTMRMAKRVKREEEKEPENGPQATNSARPITNPLAEQLLRRGRL